MTGEGFIIVAVIGAILGAAIAGVWGSADLLFHSETLDQGRAFACCVIGAVVSPIAATVLCEMNP